MPDPSLPAELAAASTAPATGTPSGSGTPGTPSGSGTPGTPGGSGTPGTPGTPGTHPGGLNLMDAIATADSPAQALGLVLSVLDVQPEAPTDPGAPDRFVGTSYRPPWGRIFGGQVLAQSLVAAIRTAPEGRDVHSLHAYFLRAGDPELPITFEVERLRDGRSFSARRTQALQRDRPILSMISSFQEPSEGIDHQDEMPKVPGPEEIPSLEERYGQLGIPAVDQMLRSRPVDLRHVEGPLFLEPGPDRIAHQAVWLRAIAPMATDQVLHTALLAFASDYSLLESVLRRHGLSWADHRMRSASLDHAMWFHRPARVDEWLLYVQESPSASGARGLGTGRIFTADGILVATVAQEGMMRLPRN